MISDLINRIFVYFNILLLAICLDLFLDTYNNETLWESLWRSAIKSLLYVVMLLCLINILLIFKVTCWRWFYKDIFILCNQTERLYHPQASSKILENYLNRVIEELI